MLHFRRICPIWIQPCRNKLSRQTKNYAFKVKMFLSIFLCLLFFLSLSCTNYPLILYFIYLLYLYPQPFRNKLSRQFGNYAFKVYYPFYFANALFQIRSLSPSFSFVIYFLPICPYLQQYALKANKKLPSKVKTFLTFPFFVVTCYLFLLFPFPPLLLLLAFFHSLFLFEFHFC